MGERGGEKPTIQPSTLSDMRLSSVSSLPATKNPSKGDHLLSRLRMLPLSNRLARFSVVLKLGSFS